MLCLRRLKSENKGTDHVVITVGLLFPKGCPASKSSATHSIMQLHRQSDTLNKHQTIDAAAMPLTPEIQAILRDNPGEGLLVTPLQWTARHLELLHIEFQDVETREETGEGSGNAVDHAKAKSKGGNGHPGKTSGYHTWDDLHDILASSDDPHFDRV